MTKRLASLSLFVATTVLLVGAPAPADTSEPCEYGIIEVHGVMHFVPVEGGCWQFEDDAGNFFEPILGPPSLYCDGIAGTLTACLRPDLVSTCQVGTIVEVLDFTRDDIFTVHGTMHFIDVEVGCWQLLSNEGVPYEPVGGPPEMYQDGLSGVMTGFDPCGLSSSCQVGQLVQVVDFQTCLADVNGDGGVNVLDLIELLLCFGQPTTPPCDQGQDVNGDGTINVLDLIELMLAFGASCP
jgi:hypothetical protein